MIEIYFIALAP